jgi:hypothetical protein
MSATLRYGVTSQTLQAIAQSTPPFRDIRDSDRWELLDTVWVDLSGGGGGGATGASLGWSDPGGAGSVYRRYAPLLRRDGAEFVAEAGDVAGCEGVEFAGRGVVSETLVLRAGNQHLRAVGAFEGGRTLDAAAPALADGGAPRVFAVLVANGSWRHATNAVVAHAGALAFEIDVLRARR